MADIENDRYDLARFLRAQEQGGTYDHAVAELQAGAKTSHWMWFVFPQLAGLGHSATAQHFAISSLHEARAYLAHPRLGRRLIECADLVAQTDGPPERIFGTVDAMKLRSSMTLFMRADPAELAFRQVLDRHFDGVADEATDKLLQQRM